jgi:threonine/homoserine/homoserine lactone efflux protein
MFDDILAALPIGLVMAFLIGPVFFALLETSAIKGFRAAIALDAGVIIADILFLLAAYFMTSSIIEKLKDDPGLFIFGGSILCIYGIVSFVKTQKTFLKEIDTVILTAQKNNYIALFIKGFLLNFINIGVLGFWLGLIVVFSPQLDNDSERIVVFFSSVLTTYFIIDIGKIILAKSLNKHLTPLRIYWLKRLIAVIMFICGAVLIGKGAFPNASEEIENKFNLLPEEVDPPALELEVIKEIKYK